MTRDRSAIFSADLKSKVRIQQARIALANVIVVDGEIIGNWRRTFVKHTIHITAMPFRPLNLSNKKLLMAAVERYGAFMDMPSDVGIEVSSMGGS